MSAITSTAPGLRAGTLPRWGVAAAAGGAVLVSLLLFAVTPLQGQADFIVFTAAAIVVAISGASWAVEGRRRAKDRLATSVALVFLALTMLPLGFVAFYVFKKGVKLLSVTFLTHSMAGVGPLSSGGGIYHAIIGTLEQVLLASLISIPLGLLVAIYITEYAGGPLATGVRFLIDVMTGIPSIVAGLFVLEVEGRCGQHQLTQIHQPTGAADDDRPWPRSAP